MSEALLDSARTPANHVWPDRAARFYAQALDISDYGAAVAREMRLEGVPPDSVLDVGAGAGHPLRDWLPAAARWTALEPSRYLRARLGRLARAESRPLHVLDALWQDLPDLAPSPAALAWAANIGATQTHPRQLLHSMRGFARQQVVWLVPAQRGPKRWCLSGALPAALHGESERPGVELVLEGLGQAHAPHRIRVARWTFTARFPSLEAGVAHCALQLGAAAGSPHHAAVADHVANTAVIRPDGSTELSAAKTSNLLIWDV